MQMHLGKECRSVIRLAKLSEKYNETIAHAIHSMTVRGLQMFNQLATEENQVPTVNHNLKDTQHPVLRHAPLTVLQQDFVTEPMQTIDSILSVVGQPNDGLGPHWSSLERIVHHFHMMDLWSAILPVYQSEILTNPPNQMLCSCLLNTEENGIYRAVQWVAEHYKTGTPITLLNRPIPKLQDAESWKIWKDRLLHYYTPEAIRDAAVYLYCTSH